MSVVEPGKQRPELLDPATWADELPGILNWALDGLARLTRNGRFTESKACGELQAAHRLRSNPARDFLAEYATADAAGVTNAVELYAAYRAWAVRNGYDRPLAAVAFGKEVGRKFPGATNATTTKEKRTIRVWKGMTIDLSAVGDRG